MAKWKSICLLGGSISQGYWDQLCIGWFGRLAQKVGQKYPYQFSFHNAAMAGDTTLDAFHRLSTEAIQREADYLIISVGLNDLVRWCSLDAPTSFSMDMSKVIWTQLLLKAKPFFEKILVIGCTPVVEDRFPGEGILGMPLYYKNSDITEYNEEVAFLCEKHRIPYCKVFDSLKGRADLFQDGVHPNSEGHQVIADKVFETLKEIGWLES